jgi:hypothetical protein
VQGRANLFLQDGPPGVPQGFGLLFLANTRGLLDMLTHIVKSPVLLVGSDLVHPILEWLGLSG